MGSTPTKTTKSLPLKPLRENSFKTKKPTAIKIQTPPTLKKATREPISTPKPKKTEFDKFENIEPIENILDSASISSYHFEKEIENKKSQVFFKKKK